MKVLKIVSFEKGFHWIKDPYTIYKNELVLVELGLMQDPRIGKDQFESHHIKYELSQKQVTIHTELVDEAQRYNRYKSRFLECNAYKTEIFDKENCKFHKAYILPTDKIELFLNNDFKPERKKIAISLCQERIANTGTSTVDYVAFCDKNEEYGDWVIRICRKSEYLKEYNHYGGYVIINVTRPYYMWGTIDEIERDIKHIIREELKKRDLIDFLHQNTTMSYNNNGKWKTTGAAGEKTATANKATDQRLYISVSQPRHS